MLMGVFDVIVEFYVTVKVDRLAVLRITDRGGLFAVANINVASYLNRPV